MADKQILVDFENIIKKYKVLKLDKVWEKIDSSYKLIYNLEGLVIDNKFYANVKLIFWLDEKKENIIENVITYLYTLSCDYKSITITTIEETFKTILSFLDKEKTNNELSNFVINGTDEFNKEIKNKDINDFIQNINMVPQGNMPCISLKYKFELISNNETFTFYLKPLKFKWQLTYKDISELLDIKEVYKRLIDIIYKID